MKPFLDKDFLLSTPTAQKLFHEYAENMPIIDYHCHINPQEIAEDKMFSNITEVWLGGDHYKWRQMRSNGVDEYYITGDASPREKFQKWAETLEKAIGNPLYHWSHLELRRFFGYEGVLNGRTAEEVWNLCNAKLATKEMSVRGLIKMSNVKLICTTDESRQNFRCKGSACMETGQSYEPGKGFLSGLLKTALRSQRRRNQGLCFPERSPENPYGLLC